MIIKNCKINFIADWNYVEIRDDQKYEGWHFWFLIVEIKYKINILLLLYDINMKKEWIV